MNDNNESVRMRVPHRERGIKEILMDDRYRNTRRNFEGGIIKKRTLRELSKTMASSACLHAQPKSFSASFNGLTRTETDIFSSLVVLPPPPPVPMTCVCVCVYRAREKILSAKICVI